MSELRAEFDKAWDAGAKEWKLGQSGLNECMWIAMLPLLNLSLDSQEGKLPCSTCPNPPSCAEYGGCQLTSAPASPGWVKCSERFPKHKQRVWYYFERVGVHAGAYDEEHNQFYGVSGFLTGDVTDWMPIENCKPAAPRKEGE